jgi:hypothetical protein
VSELAESLASLVDVGIVHIDADPNDLSGYVDCEGTNTDLQNMIESVWRAVESEMGGV